MSEIDVGMGTLYDVNKQLNLNEKILTRTEIKKVLKEVKDYFRKHKDKYFMLLCKEKSDYTLFNFNNKNDISLQSAIKDLQECLENRGQIISIEPDGEYALEIWLKVEDDTFLYYIFPYDIGVIEEGIKEND